MIGGNNTADRGDPRERRKTLHNNSFRLPMEGFKLKGPGKVVIRTSPMRLDKEAPRTHQTLNDRRALGLTQPKRREGKKQHTKECRTMSGESSLGEDDPEKGSKLNIRNTEVISVTRLEKGKKGRNGPLEGLGTTERPKGPNYEKKSIRERLCLQLWGGDRRGGCQAYRGAKKT